MVTGRTGRRMGHYYRTGITEQYCPTLLSACQQQSLVYAVWHAVLCRTPIVISGITFSAGRKTDSVITVNVCPDMACRSGTDG